MATNLARMMIHFDRLLIIKSYKTLIKWSCKVRWQTKSITSLLQECLWQPNLAEWWLPLMGSYLYHMTLWSQGLVRYEVHFHKEVQHGNVLSRHRLLVEYCFGSKVPILEWIIFCQRQYVLKHISSKNTNNPLVYENLPLKSFKNGTWCFYVSILSRTYCIHGIVFQFESYV